MDLSEKEMAHIYCIIDMYLSDLESELKIDMGEEAENQIRNEIKIVDKILSKL